MKKNRLTLPLFLRLIFILVVLISVLVYILPQTSYGRGIILSQVRTVLAVQGYDLKYQQSSGNLWRRLELTQTSLSTQGATLNFDTIGLNYSLRKLLLANKPLSISLKGVDGDVFLDQLLERQQTNSNLLAKYIEDITIEEISLNLQDLPYTIPEFNISDLELLAFEPSNTHLRGLLSTDKGSANVAIVVESTEPFKAKLNILEADAVLAQHWTKRIQTGQVAGQFEINSSDVTGEFTLQDSQLSVADIAISDVNANFQLLNNEITGQLTGIAFDSPAEGDVLVDLKEQEWQSRLTSTTDLSEASAWIFRKSPMVHDYLKLAGPAPIELNLSGWQDIELTGKAVVPEGLSMMDEALENVQTDIYFVGGRTDVIVKADYQQGQMEYVRIAANQETLLNVKDMVFIDTATQQLSLDADVVFATGESGLKRLTGPLDFDYTLITDGQEESFKVDVLSAVKDDNWNFDVAITDAYGNVVDGDVAVSSASTTVALQSESLSLSYLETVLPNSIVSELDAENTKLNLVTSGQTLQERLSLTNLETIQNLLSQASQASIATDTVSFISDEQSYSAQSLNAEINLQNTKLDLLASGVQLPFDNVQENLLNVEVHTEDNVFTADLKGENSFIDGLDAKQVTLKARLNDSKTLDIQELGVAGIAATGELVFADALTLTSLASIPEVVSSTRGSLDYVLSETPFTLDALSSKPLQVVGTGTLEIGEQLQSQAQLEVSGINILGLPETLQPDLSWQQNGTLTLVDEISGLSLSRKLVPLANNLSSFGELQESIFISDVVLENSPLELLGQSLIANGHVTLLPDSEPMIDAIFQAPNYQVKAKGSLDSLALEVNLPSELDLLNSGQFVTTQALTFQGVVDVPAKELVLTTTLGAYGTDANTNLVINVGPNPHEVTVSAQWFESSEQALESIDLQIKKGDLSATTTINDFASIENILVDVMGQGKLDNIAELLAYDLSGTLDTKDAPVSISFSPFEVAGIANFVGQVQGQDLNLDIEGQDGKILGDVAVSLLEQDLLFRGELYPTVALTTTVPYLGDVLLTNPDGSAVLSGQGVVDVNQLLEEAFDVAALSEVIIVPQAWQLNGSLQEQQIKLQVGDSTAQLDWTEVEEQDVQWSLVSTIEQQATWQTKQGNLPVGLVGKLQHSSEQISEVFQGSLVVNALPIAIEGNREQIDFSVTSQLKDVLDLNLGLGLVDSELLSVFDTVAEEQVVVQGTIDLDLGSYDVSGQLSNEIPLVFSINNLQGVNALSVAGDTGVLSRVDWERQWLSVGWVVGSSLATASTISLDTNFQSNINEITELTISLDEGTTTATIPLARTTPLSVNSTVAWLKRLSSQAPASQENFKSIIDIASTLFSEEEAIQLQTDLSGQNLKVSIGEGTSEVELTVENIDGSSVLNFSTQIPSERLVTWQSQNLLDSQIIPSSLLSYFTLNNDLEITGEYNQTTRALSTTLSNDYLTASVNADLNLATGLEFKLDSSIGLLTSILETSDLEALTINPQALSLAKSSLKAYESSDTFLLEGTYSLSNQRYNAQIAIAQQDSELTVVKISNPSSDTVAFELQVPASLLVQPNIQSIFPNSIQTIVNQIPFSDDVSVNGNYSLSSRTYALDAVLKHSNANSIVKVVSNTDNQLAIQIDTPAVVATNLLTQSAQIPSRLTTFVNQLGTQAKLVAQGNYSLESQSYAFDVALNQTTQDVIPFSLVNQGDGVLVIDSELSSIKANQLLEQSGVLTEFSSSVQGLVGQYLAQTNENIKLMGSYNQIRQSFAFSADMMHPELLSSQVLLRGNAVDGLELVLNTESELLGGLELTQLPINSNISSLLSTYLQSPNTQNLQLSTKIANTNSNIFDVTVSHPNQLASTFKIELQNNGQLDSVVVDSPIGILKELTNSQVVAQQFSVSNNRIANNLIQQVLKDDAERMRLSFQILENGNYQLDAASTQVEGAITGNTQAQALLQIQLRLPSENLRQIAIVDSNTPDSVRLEPIQTWLRATPLQEVITVNANYYPYNQSYQLTSSVGHGGNLVSEIAFDNLQGQSQFELSTPLVYLPTNLSSQLNLPKSVEDLFAQWLQGSHNLTSNLELSGFIQEQGFTTTAAVNHNGYLASTASIVQNTEATNFTIDTPSQVLATLPLSGFLEPSGLLSFESDIYTLLNSSDRFKLSGQVQRQSDDFKVDAELVNVNVENEIAVALERSSGQYSLGTSPKRDVFRTSVPEQVFAYLPQRLVLDLNWQDIEQISIRARANDVPETASLQGVLNNRTDFQFTTNLTLKELQSFDASIPNIDVSNYIVLDQITNTELKGSVNIQNQTFVVDALLNSLSSTSTLNLEGNVNQFAVSGQLSPDLVNLSNTIISNYVVVDQLNQISLTGNIDIQNQQYTIDTTLNSSTANSSLNVQGDANQAAFTGQLNSQLLNLTSLTSEVQTELSAISYLPIQGSYEFANGGSYQLYTQLETVGGLVASIVDGRINLQMTGLSLERTLSSSTNLGSSSSWIASFVDFDPKQLQFLDIYQRTFSGLDVALLEQVRLNGTLRLDESSEASIWQGEVLVSTGRQDISDIRIVGQAEALYLQTVVAQAGQRLDVSGEFFPQLRLQVQGDYVDVGGEARARFEGQLNSYQQPVLNGIITTAEWQRGDLLVPSQGARIQASTTDFQNWQETLTLTITSSDSLKPENTLSYQANQLIGSWTTPVVFESNNYTATIKSDAASLKTIDLRNIQLSDLNLQLDIVGDLFQAELREFKFEEVDVIRASVFLRPKATAFSSVPFESITSTNTDVQGILNYNFENARLDVSASLQPYNQNATLTVVSELGQTRTQLNFPSFNPSAIPEFTALNIPLDLQRTLGLQDARNLNLSLGSTGVRFQSTSESLVINGQVDAGLVELDASHPNGNIKLSGANWDELQTVLNIPEPKALLTSNLIEQISALPDGKNYLDQQLSFAGTTGFVQTSQSFNLNGVTRLGDLELDTYYSRNNTSEQVKVSSIVYGENAGVNATRNLSDSDAIDIWQAQLNYGSVEAVANFENQPDNITWQVQSSEIVDDRLPLPITVNITGQLLKADAIPVGTVSINGLTLADGLADTTLKLDGSYRGDSLSWQTEISASTSLFIEALDSPFNLTGQGNCKALSCSLSQSIVQVEGLEAQLVGTLTPSLDLNGSLNHPLLKTFDMVTAASVRIVEETGIGYFISLGYQDLTAEARLNSEAVFQSAAIKGDFSYQDAQSNLYRIETQDLAWSLANGYIGGANLNFSQQFGSSRVESTLLLSTLQTNLTISGPVYLNQQAIATSNIELRNILPNISTEFSADALEQTTFDVSGYFDLDVPFNVLSSDLPISLGNLQTRLNIVEVFEEDKRGSLLGFSFPYGLVGSIENFAGIATTGLLLLDLQTGVQLDLKTQGAEGVSLNALANANSWQVAATIDKQALTPEWLELLPLPQTDLKNITNLLSELKEDVIVDADISLEQLWQQPLQVKQNKLELRSGSSLFSGQLVSGDTINSLVSLEGQLSLNGQDLQTPLPLTIAGNITANTANQISIVNNLTVESDFIEALNVSGSILPLTLYVQSPQSIVDADYLYISGQTQNLSVTGNLTTRLKSLPDTSIYLSTTEEQLLNASLIWNGLTLQTAQPVALNSINQIRSEAVSLKLSGYLDENNLNPITANFRLQDTLAIVDSLRVEDGNGSLNLSGSIDLSNMLVEQPQFVTLEEVLRNITGQLTGFVEPKWDVISKQIALPEGFTTNLAILPITASLQQSQINLLSSSDFGTVSLQTDTELANITLETNLNYNDLGVNGQLSYSNDSDSNNNQIQGQFDYQGLTLVYANETVDISGQALLSPAGVAATGVITALEQTASYRADVGWQALAKRLEAQLSNDQITELLLERLPLATLQEDVQIGFVDFSAQAFTPLQRILPYFSPEIDGTITIQNEVLVGSFKSELLTGERTLPVDIKLNGLFKDAELTEASVELVIDESPARAIVDFQLQQRVLNGRITLEYFPLQTLLGVVPQQSQAFESIQGLESFAAGLSQTTNQVSKLDLRVTGVGTAYIPFDVLQQSQVLLVAEQVIFEHESFIRQDGVVLPEALRTQGQLTLRYEQETLNIEQAQFQSYRVADQTPAGNWSASGQISEERLSVNLAAEAADLSPFIVLSPSLTELNILAKGNFNISAQGSLRDPVLFFSSNKFQADISGGYVESEDVSFLLENGDLRGRARLQVARPWQSDIEAEILGPVQLWPFDIGKVMVDFKSPAFATNFFGDFKSINGKIFQQAGTWMLDSTGDLDNPFRISGTLNPLSLQFRGDQLNLYSESFFVASSLSNIDLSLSYEVPNLVLRGAVVANQAELISRATISTRRNDIPQFFSRILFDDVLLTAPRNMVFNESFLSAEIATELYLAGSLAQPTLDGEARLLTGEINYSGQSFTLSEGSAKFDKLQGIYPTLTASAFADLDKTRLSSNPESYVIQPSSSQFKVFLNATGGYSFVQSEDRYRINLNAALSSNAIVDPNNPRALTREDIVSLLALRRITNDATTGSDNVIGELVGINVIDAASDLIEGAIGDALGEGIDIRTTGLSSLINDGTDPNNTSEFGFGVRFSGYIDESVYASYELGRFLDPDFTLSNQFGLRYDDIFGLNRLGFNLSSGFNFVSGSTNPVIEVNLGLDYEINETISLSGSGELSNDEAGLGFGIKFKW